MLKKLSEEISLLLVSNKIISIENREIYIYGIELLLSNMITFIAIIFISIVTKTFLISMLYSLIFCSLRIFAGGYHCKTYISCFFTSISIYILMLVLNFQLDSIKSILSIILVVLFSPIILMFAPVEHENNPLTAEEKVKYRKCCIIITLAIIALFIVSILFSLFEISFIISWTMTAVAALIIISKIEGGKNNEKAGTWNRGKVSRKMR